VGFPGETDAEFERTVDVVNQAKFIHVHAFPYSPRPKTAAARWTKDFVHGPVVNQRIAYLTELASQHSYEFRQSFLGQTVELLVEHPDDPVIRHGRSERYFDVHFDSPASRAGDCVKIRVERVTPQRTHGILLSTSGISE
jgi:tRNA A37 methylthiotransferase MiaB